MSDQFIRRVVNDMLMQCLDVTELKGTETGKLILSITNNLDATIKRLRSNRGRPWSEEQITRYQFLDWLRSVGCYTCNGVARQLHHVYGKGTKHPHTKGFHLGTAVYKNVAAEIWFTEIRKCLPLCKQCHKMIHSGKMYIIIPDWLK